MNNFDFELLSEQRFSNIGIDSESSIFNLYSFLVIHCLIIMLHISIHFLRYLMSKIDMHLDWLWWIKLLKLLVNKTFNLLTFGFYIRSVMEMVQFITICSILEVYIWKTESDLRIVSLGFALLILCAFIWFILANAYFACSSYKLEENKHNKFGEFIQNLKPQMKSRLLNVILSIRRLWFAIALVWMSETTSKLLIGVMTLIQVWYFAYIVISRPYLDIKSNLILISNELFFSILLSALIFLNGEEDWSSMKNTSYFSLLISNNLLTFLIVLSKLI